MQYSNIKVTKLPKAEVEIEGEITREEMERSRKEALREIGEKAVIDGFRKGNVPEHILISKFGEMYILEEAAEIALREAYPKIVLDQNLSVIARPEITITKIAANNPLGFKIRVAIFPEIILGDYKKAAKNKMEKSEPIEVSENEVDVVVKQLQENKAQSGKGEKEGDEKKLPEVDDQFVKSFGDFKNVEDFKQKIKENLILEKTERAKEKKRLEIGDVLIAETKLDLPETMIQGELQKMHLQFEEDLKRMGIKMEDYLKHAKKTLDEIKTDWRPTAEKRAKLQIILNKIAEAEKISVPKEELEKEVAHILEHHKDANKEQVFSYVDMMLTNEKVFQFLENQK